MKRGFVTIHLIIVVVVAIVATILVGFSILSPKPQDQTQLIQSIETPVPSPTPPGQIKPTNKPTPLQNDKFSDWKVYRSEKYNFEFKYPKDWRMPVWESSSILELRDKTGTVVISITPVNRTIIGKSYCETNNLQDTSRCETLEVDGVPLIIDWGMTGSIENKALFAVTNEFGLSVALSVFYLTVDNGTQLDFDPKEMFKDILSTFRFD